MEKTKVMKIRLSTIMLSIIILLLVGVILFCVYKLNVSQNAQTESDLKIKELEEEYAVLENKTNNYSQVIEEVRNILKEDDEAEDSNTVSKDIVNTTVADNSGKLNLGIISIKLPEEFINREGACVEFSRRVIDSRRDDNIYEGYHFSSFSNQEAGGWLFSVLVVDSNVDSDSFNGRTIIKNSKYKVVYTAATDVQYDENDYDKQQEYKYLESFTNEILNSIEFN